MIRTDVKGAVLENDRRPRTNFGPIITLAERFRTALSQGEECGRWLGKSGEALADAVIQNNEPALQAVAFLYVHNFSQPNDKDKNKGPASAWFAEDILTTLIEANQEELFPLVVNAIHQACLDRWTWNKSDRLAWRELNGIPVAEPAEHLPDFFERDDKECLLAYQEKASLPYSYAFSGEIAWRSFGQDLSLLRVMYQDLSDEPPSEEEAYEGRAAAVRLGAILSMYVQMLAVIPDTRRWAKDLFASIVRQSRDCGRFLEDQRNFEELKTLGRSMTDKEACMLIRLLNQPREEEAGPRATQLLNSVILDRPQISLSSWLVGGVREDIIKSGLNYEDSRGTTEATADDAEVLLLFFNTHDTIYAYASIFDRVIERVGTDGPLDFSPSLKQLLQEILRRRDKEQTWAQCNNIQVALDKAALIGTDPAEKGANVDPAGHEKTGPTTRSVHTRGRRL